MRHPDGQAVFWKPKEDDPCPAPRDKGKRGLFGWIRANKGPALTLANIGMVLIVGLVFWPLISSESPQPVRGGWLLNARFFTDGGTAVLSMEFVSDAPQPDGFVVRVGEEERTLQSISVQLEGHSPQTVRKRLTFAPSGETLDIWIGEKRVRARKG